MTDAEFEAQKERILALIERWTPRLGLKWWEITYEYARDEWDSSEPAIALTKANWSYLWAIITWNMKLVANESDENLENYFVHECMHVYLNEIQSLIANDETVAAEQQDHIERTCSMLARAFIWTAQNVEREEGHGEEDVQV